MKCKVPPIRLWIGVMVFFTAYTNYCLRSNLSVSIIGMVNKKGDSRAVSNRSIDYNPCEAVKTAGNKTAESEAELKKENKDRFDWDEHVQGILLASYFYGYTISCLPGGFISEWIGPWNTIVWAHVVTGLANSAIVLVKYTNHYWVVIVCRFFMGLMGGTVFPAVHVLISRWAPPDEKGKFVAAILGTNLGACLTWPIVGAITKHYGWPMGFHVISFETLIFVIAFALIASDSPKKHRWITDEERDYILASHSGTVTAGKKVPPYKSIFTSIHVYALICAHFGTLWGLYLILTGVPKFINQVFGFNVKHSGFLGAAPFVVRLIFAAVFGSIGDIMQKREILDVTIRRKTFIIFSHLFPSLFLLLIMFIGCNWQMAIALLVLSQMMNAAIVVSNLQNVQDLAPNFPGTIFGIVSFVGGFTGLIVPSMTGVFINALGVYKGWQWNFFLGSMVELVAGLIFIFFGSGKVQSWNEKVIVQEEAT